VSHVVVAIVAAAIVVVAIAVLMYLRLYYRGDQHLFGSAFLASKKQSYKIFFAPKKNQIVLKA